MCLLVVTLKLLFTAPLGKYVYTHVQVRLGHVYTCIYSWWSVTVNIFNRMFLLSLLLFLGLLSSYLIYLILCTIYCMCLSLSIEPLLTLPFTLEGDRWWIARAFDSGSVQQELHWPSCKPLSYIFSVRYVFVCPLVRSCWFVLATASTLCRGTCFYLIFFVNYCFM